MNTSLAGADVLHNIEAGRYEIDISGELATAEYKLQGKIMLFTHTWVPPALRGKGLAEKLVRTALQDARAQHHRVVPLCSYVAKFIERHREFSDLVEQGR